MLHAYQATTIKKKKWRKKYFFVYYTLDIWRMNLSFVFVDSITVKKYQIEKDFLFKKNFRNMLHNK